MAHFAVFSPPFHSHIRAIEAIAQVLVERGHRATLLHHSDVAAKIREPALGFHTLGASSHPPGSLAVTMRRTANPGGPINLLRLIHDVSRTTAMLCREGPEAVRAIGADAVIADQFEPAGGLVAAALGLPYVTVASALLNNREPAVPLPFLHWDYDPSPAGLKRNRGGMRVSDALQWEQHRVIARSAAALGLPPRRLIQDCLSPFAQVSQGSPGFDFPRAELPQTFHYVGLMRSDQDARQVLDLPIRDDRPFIFVSLGTLLGSRIEIFQAVAAACQDLGAQLLVAHCGNLSAEQAESIGATWVTDFAPQHAVLRRADAVVTHAGFNTVLDSLAAGVPMLALPIAFDQPGVGSRLIRSGAGLRLMPRRLDVAEVRKALEALLSQPRYRERAAQHGAELLNAGGVRRVADVIEAVAATKRPVIR